jgi:hypothetical protein
MCVAMCVALAMGLVVTLGCTDGPDAEVEPETAPRETQITGHERMVAALAKIARDTPTESPFLGTKFINELKPQVDALGEGATGREACELNFKLGEAYVRHGDLEVGIAHLKRAYELIPTAKLPQHRTVHMRFKLGVAYMRLGETQNCCASNTPDSCILPIRGGGLHTHLEGSTNAIRYFKEVLDITNSNATAHLSSQWLLNIAYMTLGGYPDKVPSEFLISPRKFRSEVSSFPRFVNIAQKLGLNRFNLSGGVVVDDFNNDGYLDIISSTWDTNGQLRFFVNDADGTFSDRTAEAGLVGLFGGLNMLQTDFNNDGHLDIMVFRGAWLAEAGQHPNSLIRNNGDGTFTDVTFEAGLGEVHYPTLTGAWADYDNDGDLDLFVGNETTNGLKAPCQLFRNNGDETFTDVAQSAGVENFGHAKGTTWGDFNGDQFPDLYVSNYSSPNRLYKNNGDGTFTDVAEKLGVDRPISSFPTWFWDYDNDGVLDLFVSSYAGRIYHLAAHYLGKNTVYEQPRLYRGDGIGGFTNVAAKQGLNIPMLPMGSNFGDLDNDGYLDFYLGTGDPGYESLMPNMMFANIRGRRFMNVTMASGLGHLQKGHGVAFADLDNDGDADLFQQMGGAYPSDKYGDALYENPGFRNHWIGIKLVGVTSNRAAIGARIHAEIEENGSMRSIYKHVNSGGSFGANPLRQTLGLDNAERVLKLSIFWPTTGRTQVFHDIEADQFIRIVEDEEKFTKIDVKKLRLSENAEYRANLLLKKRNDLDKTIWKDEVLSQEYEQVFVNLWDQLRAAKDKLKVVAEFPFQQLILGKPQEPQSRDLGITVTQYSGQEKKLDPEGWQSLLAQFRQAGFEIVQTEWHHAEFYPADPSAVRSTVNMTAHVLNRSTEKRYIIKAALRVDWEPRSSTNDLPRPRTIDATALKIIERQGEPAFRLAHTIRPPMSKPGKTDHPILPMFLYDLDRDGLSEIIVPYMNSIYWNRGHWKFEPEPLFKHHRKGLTLTGMFADFTGDGRADFLGADVSPLVLFSANANGQFDTRSRHVAASNIIFDNPMAFTAGDIDSDGDLDVWVGQYKPPYIKGQMPTPYYDANDGFPAYLFRNDGKGRFTDITESAGLAKKRFRRTYSGSLVDVDDDQDLDLVVCSDFSGLDIYLNDGRGKFTDVTDTFVDHRHSFGMSLTFGDYNRDGRIDMFMVGMGSTTARRLDQLKLGRDKFPLHQKMRRAMGYGNRMLLAEQEKTAGGGRSITGFRQAPFNDQVARTGWSWGSTSFDFDNDGDCDIYVANGHISRGSCKDYCTHFWRQDIYVGSSTPDPAIAALRVKSPMNINTMSWNGYEHNCLLMNESGGGFLNVAFLMGAALEFDSRCVVSDDLDGDGRTDLIVFTISPESRYPFEIHVLKNQLKTDHHWIGIRLGEEKNGNSAMGATVRLRSADGEQVAMILSGDSFVSQHALTAHFGIGSLTKVDSIEVTWIDGTRRKLVNPTIDQYHRITKAQDRAPPP